MAKVMAFLKNKKTNIVGVAALIVVGLTMFGVLDESTAKGILALLGPAAVLTIRDAIGTKP